MKATVYILLATLSAPLAVAQRENTVILSHEDAGLPNEAEVLPIPGGSTLMATRIETGGPALYTATLDQVPLTAVAGTLTQTLYPADDTSLTRAHGDGLVVIDTAALEREVTLAFTAISLTELVDQLGLASGCNLYLENRQLVIDRCE